MSKYPVGETVRVTNPSHDKFDQVGTVTDDRAGITYPFRVAFRVGQTGELFRASELTLADPDVHTVLDQMDAESADPVSAPSHYRSHPSGIETITITRHESFLRGNVLKYVLRAPYKGSEIEDLKKAAQYLQWEIDRAEAAQ